MIQFGSSNEACHLATSEELEMIGVRGNAGIYIQCKIGRHEMVNTLS